MRDGCDVTASSGARTDPVASFDALVASPGARLSITALDLPAVAVVTRHDGLKRRSEGRAPVQRSGSTVRTVRTTHALPLGPVLLELG